MREARGRARMALACAQAASAEHTRAARPAAPRAQLNAGCARPDTPLMAALPALTRLRALAITCDPSDAAGCARLPPGFSDLTALTCLELTPRLRDRGPEGNEPEDFAVLGRGGGGDEGLLRAWGLRRLVVRDFGGPLHMPEGMERFSELRVRARARACARVGVC